MASNFPPIFLEMIDVISIIRFCWGVFVPLNSFTKFIGGEVGALREGLYYVLKRDLGM